MTPLTNRRVLGLLAGLALAAAACNSTAPSTSLNPPQPVFPSNGTQVVSSQVTLMADHGSANGASDITDRFELSTTADFAQFAGVGDNVKLDDHGSNYTFSLPPTNVDTVYYWRVRSSNGVATSAFSAPQMFVYRVQR